MDGLGTANEGFPGFYDEAVIAETSVGLMWTYEPTQASHAALVTLCQKVVDTEMKWTCNNMYIYTAYPGTDYEQGTYILFLNNIIVLS